MADIKPTVMAIREEIMRYFKDTCVERMTMDTNVSLSRMRDYFPQAQYQYQRQREQVKDAQLLRIGLVPILTLEHSPDTLILHTKALNRSKELREVRLKLEEFMSKYLIGVKIVKSGEGIITYGG